MFKKKPTIKPLAPLRSSDRRKLADQIITTYELEPPTNAQDQTPEQKAEVTNAHTALRNSLLPDSTQSARFTTTLGPDLALASGTVYVASHTPSGEPRILWFQLEGLIYPSVYTLWHHPSLVPLLHTPEVAIQNMKKGSDLMQPGLAGGPPFPSRAKKGAVVAVASLDRPSVPVAVGVCEVDVSALESVRGSKGRAVRNLHWAGDEAWGYGASGRAGQGVPESIEGWGRVIEEGGVALDESTAQPETVSKQTNGYNTTVEGEDAPSNTSHTPTKEFTQQEIDSAFRNAFLYGIHKHKESNPTTKNFGLTFPLSQSFVMSDLIQPFLPAFTPEETQQLQIKKTSWKNLKKFIKALDKQMIIKSKEINGQETVIWDIDFSDPAIVDFKPYRLPKKETLAGTSQGRGATATEQIDTGDESVGQKLQVVTYYKPTSKLAPLFASTTKQLLTPPEVREIITAYLETSHLISETNKRLIKLDPTLSNSVFDGSGPLDKEVLAKGTVPRDALIDRVLHAMSSSYAIVRNNSDPTSFKARSGAPPKVHITLEKRTGNKKVTKVSGLEAYFISPKLLADELRKACAGSTSVEPLAGATKKNERPIEEVMIQGPQQDAVVAALERRGVERRWVEVLDKSKGKK